MRMQATPVRENELDRFECVFRVKFDRVLFLLD